MQNHQEMLEAHTTGTAADTQAAQVITALGKARASRVDLRANIDDMLHTEARLAEALGWDAPQVSAIGANIDAFEKALAKLNIHIAELRAQLADAPTLPTEVVRVVRAVS